MPLITFRGTPLPTRVIHGCTPCLWDRDGAWNINSIELNDTFLFFIIHSMRPDSCMFLDDRSKSVEIWARQRKESGGGYGVMGWSYKSTI